MLTFPFFVPGRGLVHVSTIIRREKHDLVGELRIETYPVVEKYGTQQVSVAMREGNREGQCGWGWGGGPPHK